MDLLTRFAKEHQLADSFITLANCAYIPIANQLAEIKHKQQKPLFVGINGCQGSGKSTLAAFIKDYLSVKSSLNVIVISLDDFYLSAEARQHLAQNVHPLLLTRGVPGTHDVTTLAQVLDKLGKQQVNFSIPRFDKATDNTKPSTQWTCVRQSADIVIMEGWCWGTEPQTQAQLSTPVNELEQQHDQDGQWRRYVNEQLTRYYLPLYSMMQHWIYLQAPSFNCVYQWRLQQEHQLKAHNGQQAKIMSDLQVEHFIAYFQRLTEHSFHCMPSKANSLIKLSPERALASFKKNN